MVFPNPAIDKTRLTIFEPVKGNDSVNLFILDTSGKVIGQYQNLDAPYEMDISNLPAGLYFLKFQAGNRILKGRFIKVD